MAIQSALRERFELTFFCGRPRESSSSSSSLLLSMCVCVKTFEAEDRKFFSAPPTKQKPMSIDILLPKRILSLRYILQCNVYFSPSPF